MKLILITPNKKQDYTTECIIEGFKKLNCTLYASDLGNGIVEAYDDEILKNELHDSNAIVYFFGKVRDNRPPKHHLFKDVKNVKKIYVDGSEWTYTGYPEQNQIKLSLVYPHKRRGSFWVNEPMLQMVDFYFKRETYPEDQERGIIPLPFGLMDRHIINSTEKDIDLFCVFGQTNTGLRKEVYDICQKLSLEKKYKIIVSNSISNEEYKNLIARSRIVVDAWGGGDNCDRFYEAIGAKACCLYQRYQTIVPNPFIDNTHAISYSNINEFIDKLQFLLQQRDLSIEIGNEGYKHAIRYHSSIERSKSIIEKILG